MSRSSRVPLTAAASLVQCAKGLMDLAPPDVDPAAWDTDVMRTFLAAADFHRVTPGLHVLLRGRSDLPAAVRDHLVAAHADQLARHVASLAAVRIVGRAAGDVGTPWAVLKGPALAETIWPRPDLRASYDLDVLVPATAVRPMILALSAIGATVPTQPWSWMRRRGQAQVTLVFPSGVVCDLHWELVPLSRERRAFHLPVDPLLTRARSTLLGDVEAPVLAVDDALLHVAVHTVLAAAGRLVWLLDLAHLARSQQDWDGLLERARATRTALALAVALQRTALVCPDAVPDHTARLLGGGEPWARLLAGLDRRRPITGGPGRRGQGRLLISATRNDTTASLRAALTAVPPAVSWVGRTPQEGPSLHGRQQPADLRAALDLAADIGR